MIPSRSSYVWTVFDDLLRQTLGEHHINTIQAGTILGLVC